MPLFSAPADRNKQPILTVISDVLKQSRHVLEIGSGTGQHALFFAGQLPHLLWQPTDCGEYLPDLITQMAEHSMPNIAEPLELDVRHLPWQVTRPVNDGKCADGDAAESNSVDLVYTTNTLHIMGWDAVEDFFTGVGQVLKSTGHLIVYGPFKYGGEFTTPSNADFERWLKNRDPASGIRDFEAVDALASLIGLTLIADHSMPANNQCLVWQRV